jgi:ribosomal-protein-alanine N-acetyltransferase
VSAQLEPAVTIRRMRRSDVTQVIENERESYSHPWSERIFHDCLRVGYRAWVAEDRAGRVVGHALASIAVGEAHVLNLCVGRAARRRGAASQLLEALMEQVIREGAHVLFLEVRPSNKPARRLYAHYGFERIATRPGYYPAGDGREDALVLARDLAP